MSYPSATLAASASGENIRRWRFAMSNIERGDRVSTMTTDVTREELFEALQHACQARDFAYIDRLLDQLLDLT